MYSNSICSRPVVSNQTAPSFSGVKDGLAVAVYDSAKKSLSQVSTRTIGQAYADYGSLGLIKKAILNILESPNEGIKNFIKTFKAYK